MSGTVTISRRFCGPSNSGNGGYSCGLLARGLSGAVEVTLRAPPPLDRPLALEGGDVHRLLDGDTLIGEARRAPDGLELALPEPASFRDATRASRNYIARVGHVFPECFVCGPEREPSDALCIFPGRIDASDLAARAPWIPDASLDRGDGVVDPVYLWAALDCPGYFGVARTPIRAVLGRITAVVDEGLGVGTRCVAMGWGLGEQGRKLFAGSALFDEHGRAWARSRQVWIRLD